MANYCMCRTIDTNASPSYVTSGVINHKGSQ